MTAKWPVEVRELESVAPEPIEPGDVVPVSTASRDGALYAYLVRCPRCGELSSCPVATRERPVNSTDADGNLNRVWAAGERNGRLSMTPSLLCACGAHYWLDNGILEEI